MVASALATLGASSLGMRCAGSQIRSEIIPRHFVVIPLREDVVLAVRLPVRLAILLIEGASPAQTPVFGGRHRCTATGYFPAVIAMSRLVDGLRWIGQYPATTRHLAYQGTSTSVNAPRTEQVTAATMRSA